jgi:ABC-type transporter Mla MlaB component
MPTPERGSITILISGPIAPADLPGLYRRVCALLDGCDAAFALCDVDGVTADAVTVDALARLQLAAHRHQCQVRLRGASRELHELVAFMGLRDVLPG